MNTYANSMDLRAFAAVCAERHQDEFNAFIKERRIADAKEQIAACQQSLDEAMDTLKSAEAM